MIILIFLAISVTKKFDHYSYMLPCYIGLGYPVENAAIVEQVERPVKSTLHFDKW